MIHLHVSNILLIPAFQPIYAPFKVTFNNNNNNNDLCAHISHNGK